MINKLHYTEARKRGYTAKMAFNFAKTEQAFRELGGVIEHETDNFVRSAESFVRVSVLEMHELPDVSYVDTWTDIPTQRRERIKQEILERVKCEGLWGIVGEWFDGAEWHVCDCVWDFVGDDWKWSGCLEDVKQTAIDAFEENMMQAA